MLKRAIPPTNKLQQERQDRARELGCIYCIQEMVAQPLQTEIHHLTRSGRQLGQDFSVAACAYHHRNICLEGVSQSEMRHRYGPSLHSKRDFERRYGDIYEQLSFQDDLLGVTGRLAKIHKKQTRLSSSKIVPRKAA